jgi:hypothetical protein
VVAPTPHCTAVVCLALDPGPLLLPCAGAPPLLRPASPSSGSRRLGGMRNLRSTTSARSSAAGAAASAVCAPGRTVGSSSWSSDSAGSSSWSSDSAPGPPIPSSRPRVRAARFAAGVAAGHGRALPRAPSARPLLLLLHAPPPSRPSPPEGSRGGPPRVRPCLESAAWPVELPSSYDPAQAVLLLRRQQQADERNQRE